MALSDILERIQRDAEAEAEDLLVAARADAQASVDEARAAAEAAAARTVERARADAEREAATLLAGVRLTMRDAELTARLALLDEVLAAAEQAVLDLPDDRYAELLARNVADSTLGGETVLVSEGDAKRLGPRLQAALKAAGADVVVADETAQLAHGVLVKGDRTSVEVSPAAMIESRRAELIAAADAVLFGGEG